MGDGAGHRSLVKYNQPQRLSFSLLGNGDVKVSTLWFRVLKGVYPDLSIDKQDRPYERVARQENDAHSKRDEVLRRAVKGSSTDPWKTGVPEPATPVQSTDQPPTGLETIAILWAAGVVLCCLLYGILAALRAIAGRTTCLFLWVLLTATVLWFIVKKSKLSYKHKPRWVAAAASVMILMGIGLLSSSRGAPMFLSARAATAQSLARSVKDSDHLDLMKALPTQAKTAPTEAIETPQRHVRGASAAAQLTSYIEAVKNGVTEKWNLSEISANTPAGATVYIQFAVRRQRNHVVPTVETSSGSASLDASCLRAINRAQPFGHFPNSYTGESLTVLYHCTYPGSPAVKQVSTQPVSQVSVDGVSVPQPPINDSMVTK
jgi:TonB-like protein